MGEAFYSHARRYDLMFPGGGRAVDCYRAAADRHQKLPLLLSIGGLRLVERVGDWSGRPFAGDTPLQLCTCESASS